MSPRYDDDLRLAHVIADQVDSLTLDRFRAQDLHVEAKPDLTPVTDAVGFVGPPPQSMQPPPPPHPAIATTMAEATALRSTLPTKPTRRMADTPRADTRSPTDERTQPRSAWARCQAPRDPFGGRR